ncbi:PA0069 family radical SAM protein [Hahella aquimaris]|uniref:PA0069 family radical SAM protein n=1 Tax=Hahella sp. HNIBRBA332 TaxID=3015983 RepID=UPI00273B5E51|nr:PA0069 family radical SAM protein [Hahella sp. HNIBRBA332]WLQ14510.1 PA0069 family radical SAM protein [Hahella sp. HNIBRBA332]
MQYGEASKGRGTGANPHNRFHPQRSESDPAELAAWSEVHDEAYQKHPQTEYIQQSCQSIVSKNNSPDIPFTYSINPYQGCEHGCVYCYARPSHEYLDLSLGLDFETKIYCKTNAAEKLRVFLDQRNYRCETIAIGGNTDPYQPSERQLKITRSLLNVMVDTKHPVTLITKSNLILRDIDLLRELAFQNLVKVMISVTTMDVKLKNILEPRAASPKARLKAIETLRREGIPVGVMVAPVIPGINDPEIEDIVTQCANAGALNAGYILLRLPHQLKELYESWLQQHYPLRKEKALNLLRECRNGELYQSDFRTRQSGVGHFARLIEQRFSIAAKRNGLNLRRDSALRTDLFTPPGTSKQIDLFSL